MTRHFPCDDVATDYLKAHDKRLGEAIDIIGHVNRQMDDDLFSAVVHHIVRAVDAKICPIIP